MIEIQTDNRTKSRSISTPPRPTQEKIFHPAHFHQFSSSITHGTTTSNMSLPINSKFPILLLDGGLGTTLEDAHSIKFNNDTPLWSSDLLISSPETLLAAQKSFVDAGVDVLLSATYQGSFEGFGRTRRQVGESGGVEDGLRKRKREGEEDGVKKGGGDGAGVGEGYGEEEAEVFMRSAISIARRAFSYSSFSSSLSSSTHPLNSKSTRSPQKIALSLGAYGATMSPSQEYTANYDPQHSTTAQLVSWHQKRLDIFQKDPEIWGEVEFVAFETIPLVEEIVAVREVMFDSFRREGGKKFWVSCVFPGDGEKNREGDINGGYKLPDSSIIPQIIHALLSSTPESESESETGRAIPFGIGINCTKVSKLRGLILEFEDAIEKSMDRGEIDRKGWPWLVIYPDGAGGLVYNTSTQIWDVKSSLDNGLDGVC